jgi:hypothetical protein
VVAGKLTASTLSTSGEQVAVGEGDLVGEMSLLTRARRTATVRAVRDCSLLQLSEGDFNRIVMQEPFALFDVARTVADRLDRLIHGRRPGSVIRVAAVVPYGANSGHASFVGDLAEVLGTKMKTVVVDRKRVAEDLGSDAADDAITSYLHGLELESDLALLIADVEDCAWNHRCVRQADVNPLIGTRNGTTKGGVTGEAFIPRDDSNGPTHLVVTHDGDARAALLNFWRAGQRTDITISGRGLGQISSDWRIY